MNMHDGARPVMRLDVGVAIPYPLSISVDVMAAMLNFELADHDVYDGGELQWFDDAMHGTGMLAFLSRRADRRVDYYAQRGLRLDRGGYEIGGGTRSWNEIDFDTARLHVADDGVDAHARFTDVDGRSIEVHIDDRNGRSRRRAALLAPVSAGIERPKGLLLVWMPRFDLVRMTATRPVIRIDGRDVGTGRLPGTTLHRRHLIKYASPLVTAMVNPAYDGPLAATVPNASAGARGERCSVIRAERSGHRAQLVLDRPMPDLAAVEEGQAKYGRWHVEVDGARLTGGRWTALRTGGVVDVGMDVDERWAPKRLPWLMRVVTTVLPVFRSWPTTYRWRGSVRLTPAPTMTSRWERTSASAAEGYRRATGS